jgi:heme-degrading monooxygenase HmoA
MWRGTVPTDRADDFRVHLEKTGVAEYRQHGALDVRVLRRQEPPRTHFVVLSTWEDMHAVMAFAGPEPDVAVLYPDDDVYGLVPDHHVTHYELD